MRNIVLCKLYDPVLTYFIGLYNDSLHPLYRKLNRILLTVKYTSSLCVEKKNQLDATEWFIALMLNMFRALLCPSSGARDYMRVITAYGVQCLVAGCRGSSAG